MLDGGADTPLAHHVTVEQRDTKEGCACYGCAASWCATLRIVTPFDHEDDALDDENSTAIVVRVRSGAPGADEAERLDATATLRIAVRDVNEPPVASGANVTLSERSGADEGEPCVEARDPDAGDDAALAYALVETAARRVRLDTATGCVSILVGGSTTRRKSSTRSPLSRATPTASPRRPPPRVRVVDAADSA